MVRASLLLVAAVLCLAEGARGLTEDKFSAVVVEYSPVPDPKADASTNILNNVHKYVDIINTANNKWLADIIVFPEVGLRSYGDQIANLEIPDPADNVTPCAKSTSYEAPLVQLSCAARATGTYIVVNVDEKSFNSTTKQTSHFNTDVVIDSQGAIIARYRKIHLYEEGDKQPSKGLVYFDTAFGVRFGILTCFDIVFQDPGVDLARKYNISYFIFPTAWFSEMPFLTAIQQQWYWSYSLNVVLLASGHNLPSAGSSGTGIYLGRQGPVVYNLTETTGSFMLQYDVPRRFSSSAAVDGVVGSGDAKGNTIRIEDHSSTHVIEDSSKTIALKRDFLDVYATKPITVPEEAKKQFTGSETVVPFTVKETVCDKTFCCSFSLSITSVFNKVREPTVRGDDYSRMKYRLAAFDGVRPYCDAVTGGLQTCAIIPCVNNDLKSCGLRADDPSAEPNMVLDYFQTAWIFERIVITGLFHVNDTLVGPNVLIGGEYDNFGALLGTDSFVMSHSNFSDTVSVITFTTSNPISNLVAASVYGRVFWRDGQPYTKSSALDVSVNLIPLLTVIALLLKCSFW